MANEYLASDAPLRLALARKARANLHECDEVSEEILAGATFSRLSISAQQEIQAYRQRAVRKLGRKVAPPLYRNCLSMRRNVQPTMRRHFAASPMLRTSIRQRAAM